MPWTQFTDAIGRLVADRRLQLTLAITAAFWLAFDILGDPSPLNGPRTGALLMVVGAVVFLAEWMWRRLLGR